MPRKADEILISGIGVISPFGKTPEEFWEGLVSKKKVEKVLDCFQSLGYENPPGIEIPYIEKLKIPEERILYMGGRAISSAIRDWGGNLSDFKRIGLIVGSGLGLSDQWLYEGNYSKDDNHLSSLAEKLAASANLECETIYIGNACCSGSQAISYGMDLLELGDFDLVIAGGIDILSQMAYAGFLRLHAIDYSGCKPFDINRKGIMVGEGAAFYVMHRQSQTNKNQKVYCSLTGTSVTSDAFHVVQMNQDGVEISRAITEALQEAGQAKGNIDLIVAHGTGTVLNDRVESKIINEFFGEDLSNLYVTSPKGAIGHTGGASGALGVLVAIGSIVSGIIPPILNLESIDPECKIPLVNDKFIEHNVDVAMVNAFAFGGTNVVIICEKYNTEAA